VPIVALPPAPEVSVPLCRSNVFHASDATYRNRSRGVPSNFVEQRLTLLISMDERHTSLVKKRQCRRKCSTITIALRTRLPRLGVCVSQRPDMGHEQPADIALVHCRQPQSPLLLRSAR
jgi:hypothetical protein